MCNMNKTLSNFSGDVVWKMKLKQTHICRFLQCPQRRGGFFLSSSNVPETYKYLSCLELVNTYDFYRSKIYNERE